MQLGLTIPLMRQLNIKKLPYGEALHRRRCWDLHGISLHGQRCLLSVHCETRYTFVLFRVSPVQWSCLPETFTAGLSASLHAAGFDTAVIRAYLQTAGELELTRTHGRREVAFLNRAWDDVTALDYCIDREQQAQPLLEHTVNHMICNCAGCEGYETPLVRMRQSLEETTSW